MCNKRSVNQTLTVSCAGWKRLQRHVSMCLAEAASTTRASTRCSVCWNKPASIPPSVCNYCVSCYCNDNIPALHPNRIRVQAGSKNRHSGLDATVEPQFIRHWQRHLYQSCWVLTHYLLMKETQKCHLSGSMSRSLSVSVMPAVLQNHWFVRAQLWLRSIGR